MSLVKRVCLIGSKIQWDKNELWTYPNYQLFLNTFFEKLTFKGTCLGNNRVPSLNKGIPRVNILDYKFVRMYLLIINKHSENFVKIATPVRKLPEVSSLLVNKLAKLKLNAVAASTQWCNWSYDRANFPITISKS